MRHLVHAGKGDLGYWKALGLLETSAPFRTFLTDTVLASTSAALRWETPPITLASAPGRRFEFVVVADPLLAVPPEPDVFGRYFEDLPPDVDVLAVSNLGRTAKLVVPREIAPAAIYAHLQSFLLQAPAAQVHSMWRCVARTALRELSERPLWISTAGGGVSWLHVRLEREPKYYTYRPYANEGREGRPSRIPASA